MENISPVVVVALISALAFLGQGYFMGREINELTQALFEMADAHKNTVAGLQKGWQEERNDLLDRLMARDLPEVKMAQAVGRNAARAGSKMDNVQRIISNTQKAMGE